MAALDWLMAADLSTAQCEALEEAYSCLKGGGLRHAKDAESWLSWLLDSCQDKSSASARVAALHLLAQTIPRCSRVILGEHVVKLSQVLRSALSSAAPVPCRRLAAHCVASMVAALKGQADEEAATNESNQQELNEAMPKLVAAMVSCAAGDDETGAEAKCAALHGLGDCLRVLGSQLKPHASKIEVAAYRCLLDPAREVRKAAAETLASVPLSLKDADVWTAMVAGQAGEALATLHQVWPDAISSSAPASSSSSHRPLLPPFSVPKAGGAHAYSALCRRRLDGLVLGLTSLLATGFPTSVTLPVPCLLGLCESLLHAAPKSTSPLAPSATALPPAALHALLPSFRHLAVTLLTALLAASGRSCLRHMTRLNRLVLRLLSLPVSAGLREEAYRLTERLVQTAGPGCVAQVLEPSLPLVVEDVKEVLLVEKTKEAGPSASLVVKASSTGRKRGRGEMGSKAGPGAASSSSSAGGLADGVDDASRAVAGLSVLRAALVSSGPALSSESRRLVEELAARGLVELSRGLRLVDGPQQVQQQGASERPGRLTTSAAARQAFVGLCTAVAAVSLPDGSGTGLLPLMVRVVGGLVLDPDQAVAREALMGRAVIDAILHPRACPLAIPRSLLEADAPSSSTATPDFLLSTSTVTPMDVEEQSEGAAEAGGEAEQVAARPEKKLKAAKGKDEGAQQQQKKGAGSKPGLALLGGPIASSKKAAAAAPVPAKAQPTSAKRPAASGKQKQQTHAEEEEDDEELPDIVDEGPDDDDESDSS